MAISLIIGARRAIAATTHRAEHQPVLAARYSYGSHGHGGQRVLSAGLALAIVGGVGSALMLGLVLPEVLAPTDQPIAVTNIPLPHPDPVPQPDAPLHQPTAQRITTVPNPLPHDDDTVIASYTPPLPPIDTNVGAAAGGEIALPRPVPPPVIVAASRDPRFITDFQPDYPAARAREGVAGSCSVRTHIGADGRVTSVSPVDCADNAFFTATERQALRHWRFHPGTRDGVAVATELVQTVRFVLPES